MSTSRPESRGDEDPFTALRPRLFGIAYGITGSVADAEDVCQDTWMRWQSIDMASVEAPEGYLVRLVSNGAIDRLRSAKVRRATYVGPYLPEPLLTEISDTSLEAAERADELTYAFLVMLDELSPVERVVILLHDVFGYTFDEVARTVDRPVAGCRQMASRSRRRLQGHERRALRGPDERKLVDQLIVATIRGDVEAMMTLLADNVVQIDDGGAKQRAARHPVVGRERVARFIVNLAKRLEADVAISHIRVNGSPGLLLTKSGAVWLVFVFDFDADGLLERVYAQVNPDKLGHLQPTRAATVEREARPRMGYNLQQISRGPRL